jgi:hypothetical protein
MNQCAPVMNQLLLPHDFTYQSCPPQGYSYEVTLFKRNILAIWICNHGKFSYTDKTPKSIWGFYDRKTKCYYAPINSSKQGDKVDIKDTTPYSSMQLNLNPLEAAFV